MHSLLLVSIQLLEFTVGEAYRRSFGDLPQLLQTELVCIHGPLRATLLPVSSIRDKLRDKLAICDEQFYLCSAVYIHDIRSRESSDIFAMSTNFQK